MEKWTILTVDDEPINREVIKHILKDHYRLMFAENGFKALAMATGSLPDLILLDVMMPKMSGYQTCVALKKDPRTRNIPVIFVTAMTDIEDETTGLEMGAADYITKPISPAILKARIATHLALYNQNRTLDARVKERTKELNNTRLEIIQRLGRASEYKDDETGLHILRMSHYARLLGQAIGLPEVEVNRLYNAAPMHDIGKIGIPDCILQKQTALTEDEWQIMRRHPKIGAEIIGPNPSLLLQMARTIALTHHERWDGSGYPRRLKGEAIPIEGRIVAVADVFDALTSRRPYKDAWDVSRAVDYLRKESGHLFDPNLINQFMGILFQVIEVKERLADHPEAVHRAAAN
ncbi:HD-GYP domain-containing protein [Desulfoluna butyratoxydans]|uniref:Signal transduction response regulator receiver domain n=1 Tax=Desulfoluna butyratoxydans TaxID=231438 RepID=A0A4U8YLH3_9BACT|nr:two-component system response regulator [Desulfoluna butyratoxydans]VFQ43999.1 signal transduction response regulator receiver domain [Desulfoluna butyratoxydans]